MDPALAEGLRVLGGSAVVAAIVSGAITEWRTRQAEKRALRREEALERRADDRERKRDARERVLRQIDDTQGDYLGSMDWLMYRAVGATDEMARTRWGEAHWPQAQWYLIGDEELLDQVFGLRMELSALQPGAGLSELHLAKLGALRGHVASRLEAQRELVRNDHEPIWPSTAWVKAMLAKSGAAFGIPPEYQPKIKDG